VGTNEKVFRVLPARDTQEGWGVMTGGYGRSATGSRQSSIITAWALSLCLAAAGAADVGAQDVEVAPAQDAEARVDVAPADDLQPDAAPADPADEVAIEAVEAVTGDVAEDVRRKPNVWVKGRFQAGVDARRAGGESDVDLDQVLSVDLTPPAYPKLRLRGLLWLNQDLGPDRRNSALADLDDAYDSSFRAKLLHLYLEVDDVWGDSTLRIGRQRILESPVFNRVDGLFFKKNYGTWDWYAFGGVRASIYRDAHNDLVAGAGASTWVTPQTRVAFDVFYGEENRRSGDQVIPSPLVDWLGLYYPRRVKKELDSRVVSLSALHYVNPRHTLFGRYTLHDGESDEIQLTASGVFAPRDIAYSVTYRRRLDLLADRSNDVTGYYRVLGVLDKYDDVLATVQIPLSERYTLGLEGQVHESHGNHRNNANRDFWRGAIILSAKDLMPNVDATAALEYWDVSGGEGVWAITGEVRKSWERWRLRVGADYERYEDRLVRYRPEYFWAHKGLALFVPGYFLGSFPWYRFVDTDVVRTHENIYTLYGRMDYRLAENQDVWVRLTFEDDDGPTSPYWRLQAAYTVRF
jgi:hypothetical protein